MVTGILSWVVSQVVTIGGPALLCIAAAILLLRGWERLAIALAFTAAGWFVTGMIFNEGVASCERAKTEIRIGYLEHIIRLQVDDAAQRERDVAALAVQQAENMRLQNELEKPDGVCFDGGDADRVRQLWPRREKR